MLSPGNTPAEMRRNRAFYEQYGVQEYYRYDPDHGTLQGWLRRDERLQPIARMEDWVSPLLGIRFSLVGTDLALYRPDGRRFETFVELSQKVETERQRAEQAEQRVQEEHAQVERLKAQLRALGIEP